MHREGHYGAALLVFTPLAFILTAVGLDAVAMLGGAGVLIGAMLPDYDRRIPFVEHRGVTHSDAFAVAIGGVYALIGAVIGLQVGVLEAVGLAVFGFIIGTLTIAAHIAADALTPAGVEPFGEEWVSFEVTRAGNPVANWILLGLGVVATGGAYLLGRAVAELFVL